MAFAFQRRRGTTSAHSSFTGLVGELTVDTDKKTVVVHDGSVAGGYPLSREKYGIHTTPFETVTTSATSAATTVTYDAATQSVLYYTNSATANWTFNFRGNSTTTLNSILSTGQSMTLVFLNTSGTTAYYPTSIQVDGTTSGVTTKWQGGTAPTAGNASSIDAYVVTIIKTASATFTVLASQTKFA
jgi:hypothetical protein